jgi:hypothetical protein
MRRSESNVAVLACPVRRIDFLEMARRSLRQQLDANDQDKRLTYIGFALSREWSIERLVNRIS